MLHIQKQHHHRQGQGDDDLHAGFCPFHVFVLARPANGVAGLGLNALFNRLARRLYIVAHILTGDINIGIADKPSVFALDFRRPVIHVQFGYLAQRNPGTRRRCHPRCQHGLWRIPEGTWIAQAD